MLQDPASRSPSPCTAELPRPRLSRQRGRRRAALVERRPCPGSAPRAQRRPWESSSFHVLKGGSGEQPLFGTNCPGSTHSPEQPHLGPPRMPRSPFRLSPCPQPLLSLCRDLSPVLPAAHPWRDFSGVRGSSPALSLPLSPGWTLPPCHSSSLALFCSCLRSLVAPWARLTACCALGCPRTLSPAPGSACCFRPLR